MFGVQGNDRSIEYKFIRTNKPKQWALLGNCKVHVEIGQNEINPCSTIEIVKVDL